jgi:hypothetical protein
VKRLRIAVGRQAIAGCLIEPAGPALWPAVLFAHGWGGSQRQDLGKAKRLVRLGAAGATFNFRGHVRTRWQVDTVSRAHNFQDLLAAWDLLAATPGVDPDRMGVVGSSYGGYLAVLLTIERPVRWIALQAPAIYKDADFDAPKRALNLDEELPRYRRSRLGADENRVLAAAARFSGDVLIVESELDTVIPLEVIANYVDAFRRSAASVSHRVIAGADHALGAERWRRAHGRLLETWFAERFGVALQQRPKRRHQALEHA